MVGREAELQAGARLLARSTRGPSGLVLEGEPGIGKSTIWREIMSRARAEGWQVMACRPAEAEARLSFAGLADLLAEIDRGAISGIPAPQRHALEVALLEEAPSEGSGDQRAVFAGFCSVLFALACAGPLLIAIDDLQWLDRSSQAALEFALRRFGARPIGFLGSVRVGGGPRLAPGLDRALAESDVERVRLGPLSAGALHGLLSERLGLVAARPLLVRIGDAAGGNPFYALEIGRELARSGEPSAGEPLPVPDDVSELVARRIRRLPGATRRELLAVAALYRPVVDVLDRTALDPAENAGLIEIDQGRVSFAHPLFASAVYASASASDRRTVHRRLAALMHEPEERARHLALGAEGQRDEEIAAELDRAAAQAVSRGAPDAAAELLELAAQMTEEGDVDRASQRALSAAECHFHAGDRAQARLLAEQVVTGSPGALIRGRALQILGEVSYHEDSYSDAIPLFEEALTLLPEDRHAVELHVNLQIAYWHVGDLGAMAAHGRAAAEVATALGDDGALAVALASSALVDFYLDEPLDRNRIESALALEDPDRPLPMAMRPSLVAGFLATLDDDFERASMLLSRLRDRTIERGEDSDLSNLDANLAAVERFRGNLSGALGFADEGCEIARVLGSDIGQADNLSERCIVRAALGDVDGARADAALALAITDRAEVGFIALWLAYAIAFLELSLGNGAAAHEALEPFDSILAPTGACTPYTALVIPERVEALVAVGEPERAEELTMILERHGARHGRASVLARAARCRALIAAARGDLTLARQEVEEALAQHARVDMPLELGRTLLVRGQIERRLKRKGPARAAFELALAIFEKIGAQLWRERTQSELERTGARHGAGDELTPTELQVAELAANGLTNRRIAERVFLSPKTVEANLGRIYLKLGVRTRAELGRAMADRERGGARGAGAGPGAGPGAGAGAGAAE